MHARRQPGSEATFCLKAPLQSLTGVNLEPRVWVTVEPGDRAVTFSRCMLLRSHHHAYMPQRLQQYWL